MPGSSNTSFIPKRNPASGDRLKSKSRVYVGTFFVRVLFVSSIIASAGVFGYEYQLNKALEAEILALNTAIATFDESELPRIQSTDLRLSQANKRLAQSASITTLLEGIETTVTDSVQITELEINRTSDEVFEVEAQIKTTSFDSVMFQRTVMDNSRTLNFAEIDDLTLQNVPPTSGALAVAQSDDDTVEFSINFKMILAVERQNIPHTSAVRGGAAVRLPENSSSGTSVQTSVSEESGALDMTDDLERQLEDANNQEQI